MKLVDLLESPLTIKGLQLIINNQDGSWDVYKGDDLLKSFKFDNADDRSRAKKDAYAFIGNYEPSLHESDNRILIGKSYIVYDTDESSWKIRDSKTDKVIHSVYYNNHWDESAKQEAKKEAIKYARNLK